MGVDNIINLSHEADGFSQGYHDFLIPNPDIPHLETQTLSAPVGLIPNPVGKDYFLVKRSKSCLVILHVD
jgi:hypothetical protein